MIVKYLGIIGFKLKLDPDILTPWSRYGTLFSVINFGVQVCTMCALLEGWSSCPTFLFATPGKCASFCSRQVVDGWWQCNGSVHVFYVYYQLVQADIVPSVLN